MNLLQKKSPSNIIPPGGIIKFMTKIKNNELAVRSKILNRIARIEGQVRGVRKMIESKKECTAVINQVSAIKQAVNMLASEILENEFVCKFERGEKLNKKDLQTIFKIK